MITALLLHHERRIDTQIDWKEMAVRVLGEAGGMEISGSG